MAISRTRLAVVVALALLAIGVYLVFDLDRTGWDQAITRFTNYEMLRARQVAHDVETYLESSSTSLLHLARSVSDAGDDLKSVRAGVQAFSTPTPGFPTGPISVVDQAGGLLYSTGAELDGAALQAAGVVEWAKRNENKGKVLVAALASRAATHAGAPSGAQIVLVTPYWRGPSQTSQAGTQSSGLIVMSLNIESALADGLTLSSTPEHRLGFWMMDQDGVVLLQTEHPEMVRSNVRRADASCLQCHVSFSYVDKMLATKHGSATYQLKDQRRKLAAFAPVSFANASWIVVVNEAQDDVTSFLRRDYQKVLLIVGVVVVAFGLLTWSLYQSVRVGVRAEEQARYWQEKHQLEEQRQRAEAEIDALHRRNTFILDSVSDGIIGLDNEGRLTFANQAAVRMLGYTTEELQGRNSHQLWHHTDKEGRPYPAVACPIQAACRDGKVHRSLDDTFWRKDGTRFAVEYTSVPIVEANSQVGAVLSFREITERKKLEAQLRQAQKMEAIGTLAGGIAHDFNNMLSAIVGNTELMVCELPTDHPAQESIKEIFKATRRATDLVRQILTFSRQREQERRSVEVPLIAKEALKLLRATLPATIAIQVDMAESTPPILADATQLYQVIMNLAANAAHAMRERGGVLTVRVFPVTVDAERAAQHPDLHEGMYVCLSVGDTGHGMDAATLERVFEPFFTTKPPGEGTGLGLAVVHGIVQGHEGAISVHSEPGVGTTVDVYFPAASGQLGEHVPAAAAPRGNGQKILFVDDEPALCRVIQRVLADLGYEPETCSSPGEALERFTSEAGRYDLVITDLAMPVMSGRELAGRLLELNPNQRIIMVTGYSGTLTPEKARELGLRAVLHKPLDAATLGRAVFEALRSV